MLSVRKDRDRCERCDCPQEAPGFAIEDDRGYRVFYCHRHLVEELEACLLPLRIGKAKQSA